MCLVHDPSLSTCPCFETTMFDRIRKKTRGIGPLTYFLEKEEGEDDDAIEEASSTPDNSEAERSKFIQYRFHMAPEGSKESASEVFIATLSCAFFLFFFFFVALRSRHAGS